MKTEKFYKLIIIVLLLLNAGILGYLFMNSNRPGEHTRPHPPSPDRIIIDRLQLSEQQIGQFNELKHEHHMQILEIQEKAGVLHKALFTLLEQNKIDVYMKDSLMNLIQAANLQKEEVTFEHFRKLRQILTEEQKHEFDEFVDDISKRIMGPHPRGERQRR